MVHDHATVKLDGVDIPLIGVPVYGTLEECDLCHSDYHLSIMQFSESGKQILCPTCRTEYAKPNQQTYRR